MTGSQKWAKYLHSKDLKRLMNEVKRKWISYGRLTGKIVLKNVTDSERKDINGVIGKHYASDTISISAKDFEQAILHSSFGETSVKEVLDAYFGEEIKTTKESDEIKQKEDESFYQTLVDILNEQNANKEVYDWLENAYINKNNGYRHIQRLRKESKDVLEVFSSVICGIQKIINEEEQYKPIAVFASTISGNPHFLDRTGGEGATLFVSILSYLYQVEYPKDAKSWYELFQKATLLKNEIAGSVAVYNVHFIRNNEMHLGAEGCYQYGEVFMASFANLYDVKKACTDTHIAYVVENEMVFVSLQKEIKNTNIALICTSGQLSITAQKIIELLIKGNTKIFYSGDIDPEGLGICDRLWKRYPESITPWLMDVRAYEECISNEEVADNRLITLEKIENPILRETASKLKQERKAGYQENILEKYIEELRK